ncbi:MAG: polyprenyl synthetase family protein [Pirellulales bacterium]|nr:polyprenyl synthetase family protein [Pirellulales bacterium]
MMTQTLQTISDRALPQIEEALVRFSDLGPDCPKRLKEAMRYSLLAPGKRLRPMLALLATEACGGEIEPALPAACAVEMIHAYSLIHDDLPAMDDDDLRRGRPACHKAFDEATAILAGDALLTLAFETVAKYTQPPPAAAACCAALAEAAGACQLVGGQADDMEGERGEGRGEIETAEGGIRKGEGGRKKAESESSTHHSSFIIHHSAAHDLLASIHRRKTGAMIRVSLHLGGLVAGATQPQLESLGRYGDNIGLAFQVIDDLLDVRSKPEIMGKRTGKDARRGKLTFPGLIGIDQSTRYAAQLVQDACESLAPFGPRAAGLEVLARYVLERNR